MVIFRQEVVALVAAALAVSAEEVLAAVVPVEVGRTPVKCKELSGVAFAAKENYIKHWDFPIYNVQASRIVSFLRSDFFLVFGLNSKIGWSKKLTILKLLIFFLPEAFIFALMQRRIWLISQKYLHMVTDLIQF
ncbi:hypothetical protein [uncultured Draconibacterium sp.]|uniref:hypothetical protein n=1 Tax=uncultured Draconibacterium sp. TaxID=1573823 RepID=UPI0032174334